LRGIVAGVVSAVAVVSVASAAGFGFDLWRRGFGELVFAGAMVVEELEFCAETINPALVKAANTPITTTRTKG
jgi:ABC-type spermidine/putrescine transport system permease subunit II